MSGIATAIGGTAVLSYMGSREAGKSSERAAKTQAAAQMEQLEYLKEINKIPQQYREQALTKLADIYGLGGTSTPSGDPMGVARIREAMSGEYIPPDPQQEMIDKAKTSPLYAEIMGGLQTGEEAILRQAGSTGGLRSGGVQENLAKYASGLERSALTQSYNEQIAQQQREIMGLQGLAGLDTGSQQIGQTMADIGATQAAGILGQGQAYQQGLQNISNLGMQGLGLAMYGGYI